MEKIDYSQFMDITNIENSARFLLLCSVILELQAQIQGLSSLVELKYDPHVVECAVKSAKNQPWYKESEVDLLNKYEALKKAQDDPRARLQAMFKAKMEGKL